MISPIILYFSFLGSTFSVMSSLNSRYFSSSAYIHEYVGWCGADLGRKCARETNLPHSIQLLSRRNSPILINFFQLASSICFTPRQWDPLAVVRTLFPLSPVFMGVQGCDNIFSSLCPSAWALLEFTFCCSIACLRMRSYSRGKVCHRGFSSFCYGSNHPQFYGSPGHWKYT